MGCNQSTVAEDTLFTCPKLEESEDKQKSIALLRIFLQSRKVLNLLKIFRKRRPESNRVITPVTPLRPEANSQTGKNLIATSFACLCLPGCDFRVRLLALKHTQKIKVESVMGQLLSLWNDHLFPTAVRLLDFL